MFDPCRVWRKRLTRLLDGTLPLGEWAALEEHLSHCARCQKAQEADRSLRETSSLHTGLLSTDAAAAFDDRVLRSLQNAPRPRVSLLGRLGAHWQNFQARWNGQSFEFFTQLTGGALIAASVTAVCLLSALHPISNSTPVDQPDSTPAATAQNEPPVPLETLLQSASPRAALLWRTPDAARSHALTPQTTKESPAHTIPAKPILPGLHDRSPADPKPHGEQMPSTLVG